MGLDHDNETNRFRKHIPGKKPQGLRTITDHNLSYYPSASFTNAQLPLLKVATLCFDKLVILNPVGAGWDNVDADRFARDAVRLQCFNCKRL